MHLGTEAFSWGTVDSKKLEYVPGTIYDGFSSSLVGGQSYSNFLLESLTSQSGASELLADGLRTPSAQEYWGILYYTILD